MLLLRTLVGEMGLEPACGEEAADSPLRRVHIAEPADPARGALRPEACVEPEELFPELERRGCSFHASPPGAAAPAGKEVDALR